MSHKHPRAALRRRWCYYLHFLVQATPVQKAEVDDLSSSLDVEFDLLSHYTSSPWLIFTYYRALYIWMKPTSLSLAWTSLLSFQTTAQPPTRYLSPPVCPTNLTRAQLLPAQLLQTYLSLWPFISTDEATAPCSSALSQMSMHTSCLPWHRVGSLRTLGHLQGTPSSG